MAENKINPTLIEEQLLEEYQKSRALKDSVISNFPHDKESLMAKASYAQIITFEALAVFLFLYGYHCSISVFEVDAQASGCLLMAIAFTGSLSGGNINPIITASNCLKKQSRYSPTMFFVYLLGQTLGAIMATTWCELMGYNRLVLMDYQGAIGIFRVLSNQAMGVFILVFFMLILSNPNTTFIDSQLTGYVSIAVFYHIARSFAPFAGLLLNPVITLVVAVQHAIISSNWLQFAKAWPWIIGDLLGCLLASLLYNTVYQPIVHQLREIKRKSQNFESITQQQSLSNKSLLAGG